MGAGVIIPLFSLWFYLKFHINIASLGIVYAISNATLALGTLMAPTISRLLRSRVISVVMLEGLATGVLAIMPSIYDLPLLLALFIIRNTLMNMANPLLTSLINELVPREERGRVFGLWNMISSIPRAVGPGIGGYLMDIGYLDMPPIHNLYSLRNCRSAVLRPAQGVLRVGLGLSTVLNTCIAFSLVTGKMLISRYLCDSGVNFQERVSKSIKGISDSFRVLLGPGWLTMLADVDAPSILTAMQSGYYTGGLAMIPWLILLTIPLYFIQELTIRAALGSGKGMGGTLLREVYGNKAAAASLIAMLIIDGGRLCR